LEVGSNEVVNIRSSFPVVKEAFPQASFIEWCSDSSASKEGSKGKHGDDKIWSTGSIEEVLGSCLTSIGRIVKVVAN
jgi:hypothetical protein